MSKRREQGYRMTASAVKRLNVYLAEIRCGIENVCEMHTHDSKPSMSQMDFEIAYLDKILGQTVTALSVSMRSIAEALAKQKEDELKKIAIINAEKGIGE